VVYPIADDADGKGNQLINWIAEIRRPAVGLPFFLGVTQFHWDQHDRTFDWKTDERRLTRRPQRDNDAPGEPGRFFWRASALPKSVC
jgi:hypothetical protein